MKSITAVNWGFIALKKEAKYKIASDNLQPNYLFSFRSINQRRIKIIFDVSPKGLDGIIRRLSRITLANQENCKYTSTSQNKFVKVYLQFSLDREKYII